MVSGWKRHLGAGAAAAATLVTGCDRANDGASAPSEAVRYQINQMDYELACSIAERMMHDAVSYAVETTLKDADKRRVRAEEDFNTMAEVYKYEAAKRPELSQDVIRVAQEALEQLKSKGQLNDRAMEALEFMYAGSLSAPHYQGLVKEFQSWPAETRDTLLQATIPKLEELLAAYTSKAPQKIAQAR